MSKKINKKEVKNPYDDNVKSIKKLRAKKKSLKHISFYDNANAVDGS